MFISYMRETTNLKERNTTESNLPKLIYRSDVLPINVSLSYYNIKNLKFIWKSKYPEYSTKNFRRTKSETDTL